MRFISIILFNILFLCSCQDNSIGIYFSNGSDSVDEEFVKLDFKVNDTHIVIDSVEKQRISIIDWLTTIETDSEKLVFNISVNDEVTLDTILPRKDVKKVFIAYKNKPEKILSHEFKVEGQTYTHNDTIKAVPKEILIISFTKQEVKEFIPH